MKKSVKVSEITHEELVDILSTASYDCSWMCISAEEKWGAIIPYEKIAQLKLAKEHRGETYCPEDKWADILLNGGTIVAFDFYDKDDEGDEGKPYLITLETFLGGLESAYAECPDSMTEVEKFDGSADYYDANNVVQCIMFGEVVYG